MYILSVEGVAILPVETAEEIAEWLLKTPLILLINPWSLGFFSFFLKVPTYVDRMVRDRMVGVNLQLQMVGALFVLVMRTNFDERMFN